MRVAAGAALLYASGTLAAPAVNVALQASFNAAPYLIQLLETAAEENSTAYFPLLDRIADGHFDHATTDEALYDTFLRTLEAEGHLASLEDLSSFKFALSIHSAAPRIEAHYQYYDTSVATHLSDQHSLGQCDTWVQLDGKQYCSPDLVASSGSPLRDGHVHRSNYTGWRSNADCRRLLGRLPFDRVLGRDVPGVIPSILYTDLISPDFRRFHKTLSATARNGKSSYHVRYKRPALAESKPLAVSGYGVELSLKRTDYIVIDDRADEKSDDEQIKIKASTADSKDLKPLSASELSKLDLKAVSYILAAENPFDTLLDISQDFPKHSALLSSINVTKELRDECSANAKTMLNEGLHVSSLDLNVIWINGVQISLRDFDAFAMLEQFRRERKLIKSAKDLGFTGAGAISLFSSPQLAVAKSDTGLPQRYDWRDATEGGDVIIWLNNIEKDSRYSDWPSSLRALLQRAYPGQLPSVRRDIHNVIIPTDFANHDHVAILLENVQTLIRRAIPIRFGVVPIVDSEASKAHASMIYHLQETYGLSTALTYIERSIKAEGKKYAAPIQANFDKATQDRKLRRGRQAISFQEVLERDAHAARMESAKFYLRRLGALTPNPPFIANGVAIPRKDEWMQLLSTQVGMDLRMVQQAVFEYRIGDDAYVPDMFLTDALPVRNPTVIPENEADVRIISLAAIDCLQDGMIGSIPGIGASEATVESDMVHLVVVADFDSEEGGRLHAAALAFRLKHDNVELFFLHNAPHDSTTIGFSDRLYAALSDYGSMEPQKFAEMTWTPQVESSEGHEDDRFTAQFWDSAKSLLEATQLEAGQAAVLLNGRIVGPLTQSVGLDQEAFETLLVYERRKRLTPAAKVLKAIGLDKTITTPLAFAKLSNLMALSTVSDVPEGIFESPPRARTADFEQLRHEHSMIEVGDKASSSIQIVAAIDPASEQAQRYLPIIKVLSELDGVHTRVFLTPRDHLKELPIKRFYRHILHSTPSFTSKGDLKEARAEFGDLPENALLTIGMDVPPAWLVSPLDSVHDLDNLKLSNAKGGDVDAIYRLDYILIEGHSRDKTNGQPPRGAQLVLGTDKDQHFADTIIMSNLGYFQFKTNPGYYHLSLQKGRSDEIFSIDSIDNLGYGSQVTDIITDVALLSFRGTTLYPMLSRKPGKEDEDVLQAGSTGLDNLADRAGQVLSDLGLDSKVASHWLSKASGLGNSLLGKMSGTGTDLKVLPHADINIFSVASGHLYERMLNIMMVSVMKHTNHTVKFWFIEQFLSPSFKAFLPVIAAEYGFRYEMVTYKWPHWLRYQREKQRLIWGYKILFLDVLFPLDLDKVIFVDADQIVRTDMYDLVQHDLEGAPYGFTPMCDSRTEMEGFRFWKQGYWMNFLRGKPYHISALYVVDLKTFRQMAAGDRLRGQYHQLSADPGSLSNLDQDLPNHMQHNLPIHSLPQEWLWCETWCSDESLGVAKTIDLCNNPQTKEPKLDRARRQVPEWTIYDEEIAALARRISAQDGKAASPIAGSVEGSDAQAQAQAEEAEQHFKRQAEQSQQAETKPSDGRVIDELTIAVANENITLTPITSQRRGRLYGGTPQSLDKLNKPFRCPGAPQYTRISEKPTRKRRKVSYANGEEGGEEADDGGAFAIEERVPLSQRFPVFKVKDKDAAFRQRFAVPFANKERGEYDAARPPPLLGLRTGAVFVAKPLHDPAGEFAIVLYDPTIDEKPVKAIEGPHVDDKGKAEPELPKLDEPIVHKTLADILGLKKKVEERAKVPVVIDPRLAKVLRPHQVEGVKFLYRCTTGLIDENAQGCIMADEMGLGKTLQCIALMWTLLRQSPDAGKPTIEKCVIACPSSLVRNWANELVKWLGKDAISPFAVDGKATKEELIQQLHQWSIATGRQVSRPVLIISYETLRLYVDELRNTPIGLLLCDEGHRLKNGESQTFTALNGLNVQKRVILSGTPIQNDLSEYFSLLNFANPSYLGTRADFRKKYEIPILRGRDADGTDQDQKKGNECITELLTLVNKFIIRRTNDILSKYLPVKYEHVVFCNMAPFQKELYLYFLSSPDIKSLLKGKGSQPLKAIGMLKKLCNHPDLLNLPEDLPGCEQFYPEDYVPKDARGRDRDVKSWYSGKMVVLDRMLARIRAETNDKIVLISNYTQTLDIFERLCRSRNYGSLRLDGTMTVNKRQKLVDKFNDPEGNEFVFLLSSKAGGCGLNLIGANRLVLFDPDWNPAADQQALARVWRDGQKKDCFVYRFIATGTIEEKIFQRQSHKQSLSSCVVDSAEDVERHFSLDSLRELFQYRNNTTSDTHDTFKCKRCKDGRQFLKAPAMLYGDTSTWNHFTNEGETGAMAKIQDLLLRQETADQIVSAVFQYISH